MNVGVKMWDKLIVDKIFSDGIVLQRNVNNKIYGYDMPSQNIKVTIDNIEYNTYADKSGYWEVIFDKKENSGPFEMLIQGSGQKVIRDIYFGEVFLLGGQSNMELPIARVFDLYEQELLDFFNSNNNAIIRQFTMPKEYAFKEDNKGIQSGEWIELEPNTIETFSAIGYFFAKHFQLCNMGLNIGLIQTAVGGSPLESWCNENLIKKYRKNHLKELERCRNKNYIQEQIYIEERNITTWMENLLENDILKDDFMEEKFEPYTDWNKLTIPLKYEKIEELKNISGIVWLQKSINLTSDIITKINQEQGYLHLGTIVDADEVWINGIQVGSTSYQYPPRKYMIPSGVLKEGKNIIMIRHFIHNGKGEFTSTKPYHIRTKSKSIQISLRGEWYYKIGAITKPEPSRTFFTWKPTALYHSMIYPLKKIKIKGVLWYQGESNIGDGEDYGILFQEMIQLFRQDFGCKSLPFAFVQLVNYGTPQVSGAPGGWAKLRKEQEKGILLEKVAMVVGIDQGEAFDIHPVRKKVLGQRLATSMECLISGKSESYKGPILTQVVEKDNEWILKFDNVGEGLELKKPLYFSLHCEVEEKWIELKGIPSGKNQISIQKPKQVLTTYAITYAYLDNPKYVALYNSDGFPCKPFIYSFDNKYSKE